jgi:molybdenum cofactor cytidylyltransferase
VSESSIGIIVLAAGDSSRMGEPKQLLKFEGETLLCRAARAALGVRSGAVVVVLGFRAGVMQEELDAPGALAVVNESWPEGMSSSIRCGLQALEASTADSIEAAILMLCDQPFVTSDVLKRLVDAYSAGRALVVASEYESQGEQTPGAGEKTLGVPVLFNRALFPELMGLRGAEGAKRIIMRHKAEAAVIAMPEAAFDVDTPGDYRALANDSST